MPISFAGRFTMKQNKININITNSPIDNNNNNNDNNNTIKIWVCLKKLFKIYAAYYKASYFDHFAFLNVCSGPLTWIPSFNSNFCIKIFKNEKFQFYSSINLFNKEAPNKQQLHTS